MINYYLFISFYSFFCYFRDRDHDRDHGRDRGRGRDRDRGHDRDHHDHDRGQCNYYFIIFNFLNHLEFQYQINDYFHNYQNVNDFYHFF